MNELSVCLNRSSDEGWRLNDPDDEKLVLQV